MPANVKIKEADIEQWIAEDRAKLPATDREYVMYTSMHELHNEGLSAEELNIVRVALSKALNSVARWAPRVVNPVDVNGRGLLYKFDIRDYWGLEQGRIETAVRRFGRRPDLRPQQARFPREPGGYRVQGERYGYARKVSRDPDFSKKVWERVLHGNVEGAVTVGTIPSYIKGFHGKRSRNAAG